MSYSNKEKLHYFQRLQNSEASEHDLALLSKKTDANIDKYTRSPRRYADDILYALLELFPVSIIVRNRREWARREADELKAKDGKGTGVDKTETKDSEGTGADKAETKDGEGTEDTKPSAPEEPGTEEPESTGTGDESVEESPAASEEPGTEEPESTETDDSKKK